MPGAYHISSTTGDSNLKNAAFTNPDGSHVLVVHNGSSNSDTFNVRWDSTQSFPYTLPAGGIVTFKWSTTPPSTPTPTPTATPTAPPTPSPTGGACSVQYTVTNQWPGGFGANVTFTNTGSTAINGWNLTWTFPNGQTITQLWNGNYTQSGGTVSVTNASYNGTIAPGGSTNFGFNGSWNGSNSSPTAFTLNGSTCTVS
jgi:cellulase/cellobiase CelA1